MTVGELRQIIAQLPDELAVRVVPPGRGTSERAKCIVVGYGGDWRPGCKARSLLICADRSNARDANAPAPE
jgi:hypothetical protein